MPRRSLQQPDPVIYENKEEEQAEMSSPKICIIVVGDTGLGKSSVTRRFGGPDVRVSASAASHTQLFTLFDDQTNSGRQWLDTRGANDSDRRLVDQEILRRILMTLQQSGVTHIKVLWFVHKNVRRTAGLAVQAEFISSFVRDMDENESGRVENPWNSVVAIIKEGENYEDDDCIQGPLEAANEFGAQSDISCLGFTCLDWLKEGGKKRAKLRDYANYDESERFERGLFSENDVARYINTHLEELDALNLNFDANQYCVACGLIGDPRCLVAKCHDQAAVVHPKISQLTHTHSSVPYHPFTTEAVHTRGTEQYHPEGRTTRRVSSGSSHSGSLRSVCQYGHPVSNRTYKRTWTCRCCNTYYSEGSVAHCDTCCEKASPTAPHASCQGDFCWNRVNGIPSRYSCCERGSGSSGCTSDTKDESYYPCCGNTSGSGCQHKYLCCHRRIGDTGCTNKYRCCGNASSHRGCQAKMPCCGQPAGTHGCSYACCLEAVGSPGCTEQCKRCGNLWGDADFEGCTINKQHTMQTLPEQE